jgi:hypothetical protein
MVPTNREPQHINRRGKPLDKRQKQTATANKSKTISMGHPTLSQKQDSKATVPSKNHMHLAQYNPTFNKYLKLG